MGIKIYYYIIAAVVLLGIFMPQEGRNRKNYIIIMAVLHTFVCGFRYQFLTGDLQKYQWNYKDYLNYGWFSDEIIQEGRNTGFQMFMKLISTFTNGNFQIFLLIVAIIIESAVAVLIYRYSPKPWLSYLVWNCLGFYIFGFSAIKQALAMALIMYAMVGILENDPKRFLIYTLLAGFVHMPALAFLPAYWLSKRKINVITILSYIGVAGVIYVFRNSIVSFISELYYEEETIDLFQNTSDGLGGRFFLIVLILVCGIVLKGFREKNFESIFNMIVVAAIFQMFSGFDNVFTRFADYYFQFSILYIPMLFYEAKGNVPYNRTYMQPLLLFEERSIQLLIMALTVILVWYYYTTCLGVPIANPVDDYLNFRFMWDVAG